MRWGASERGRSSVPFLILVTGAAFFILATGRLLPVVVASHFALSGAADAFMARGIYVPLMLGIVVVLPLVLAFLPILAASNPKFRINLPNRDYWLAPERRAQTIEFLRRHFTRMASILVVFLCYVHWLVIRANTAVPPNLSAPWFYGGLGVFFISVIALATIFFGHFRKVP